MAVLPGERRPWSEGHLSRPRSWTQDSCPSRGLRAEAALPEELPRAGPPGTPRLLPPHAVPLTLLSGEGRVARPHVDPEPGAQPRAHAGSGLRRRQTSGAVSCGLGQAAAQDRRVGAQGA